MSHILTIARKEWATYFYSPIAYAVFFVFLFCTGINFWWLVAQLAQPGVSADVSALYYFFGLWPVYWFLLVPVSGVLTMRLFAEEKRLGTFEGLMTAPVTNAQVVLGKFLAAFGFYLLMWAPTLIYVFILSLYGVPEAHEGSRLWAALTFSYEGAMDPGPILNGYLLTCLVGASFLSIGLLVSACTSSQISAALIAMVVTFALWLVPLLGKGSFEADWAKDTLEYMNFYSHFMAFNKGMLDTRPLVYHLSITAFSLFTTVKIVEAR